MIFMDMDRAIITIYGNCLRDFAKITRNLVEIHLHTTDHQKIIRIQNFVSTFEKNVPFSNDSLRGNIVFDEKREIYSVVLKGNNTSFFRFNEQGTREIRRM